MKTKLITKILPRGTMRPRMSDIYTQPIKLDQIGRAVTDVCLEAGIIPDAIVGHRESGSRLAHAVSFHLSRVHALCILSFWTVEALDGSCMIQEGYDTIMKGKHVLIAVDSSSNSRRKQQLTNAVKKAGGIVMGMVLITPTSTAIEIHDTMPLVKTALSPEATA